MFIEDIYSRYYCHDIDWNGLIPVFQEIGELPPLYREIISVSYMLMVKCKDCGAVKWLDTLEYTLK